MIQTISYRPADELPIPLYTEFLGTPWPKTGKPSPDQHNPQPRAQHPRDPSPNLEHDNRRWYVCKSRHQAPVLIRLLIGVNLDARCPLYARCAVCGIYQAIVFRGRNPRVYDARVI